MLDIGEYNTELDGYQGNGNGYDKLEGEWLTYYKVGKGFVRRVKPEDREDFLHDLFLVFARVKASYQAKGKELTTGGSGITVTKTPIAGGAPKGKGKSVKLTTLMVASAQRQSNKKALIPLWKMVTGVALHYTN